MHVLPAPDFSLAGQVALVTGASSGLGARFAQLLAGAGAQVVLAARRTDRLAGQVAAIEAAGGRAVAVAMDVEREDSVIAGYDAATGACGAAPSIVVANAGMNARGLATDIAMDDFDQVMGVNLRGVFLTAREGARRMIAAGTGATGTGATGTGATGTGATGTGAAGPAAGSGRIILIASMGGVRPLPGLTAYSVSKAGVIMMGKALAREWARQGINVNTLCPGYVETEINADWLAEPGGQKMIAGFPRRRVMDATSLDGAMLWLASPAAAFTTGAVIQVDDGQSL